jgi:DNA polymerase III delta subunit
MFNLASETDKLSFFVRYNGRDSVTKEDVMLVATPAAEYDAFAFTNAIGARRKDEALDILRELKMRKMDPIMVMGEITKAVCEMTSVAILRADGLTSVEISTALKIHEYRVSLMLKNNLKESVCKNMIRRCKEADLELKRSGEGYAVLEKLICTI